MKAFFSSLWSWLRPKLAALFTLTCKTVAKNVLDLLNDAELQHAALDAVEAAAHGGLKGNEAFDAAFRTLSDTLRAQGRDLATNVKDTLIQNAYCVFRNSED